MYRQIQISFTVDKDGKVKVGDTEVTKVTMVDDEHQS